MDVVHALTSIYDHWKHRMQLPVDEEERERTMASKHDLARQEAVGKRRASPTDGQPMRRSERSDFPPWLRGGCGTREQIRDFSARQLCDMGKFNVHMRRSRSFTRSRAFPPLSFQPPEGPALALVRHGLQAEARPSLKSAAGRRLEPAAVYQSKPVELAHSTSPRRTGPRTIRGVRGHTKRGGKDDGGGHVRRGDGPSGPQSTGFSSSR